MMNGELVARTERFLKDRFAASAWMKAHPEEKDYRLEHSYRVANIGRKIARGEGFDEGDAGAEGGVEATEFETDGATADHEEAVGDARQIEGFGRGPEVGVAGGKYGRDDRFGAGGDEKAVVE